LTGTTKLVTIDKVILRKINQFIMKTLNYTMFFIMAAAVVTALNAGADESKATNPYFAVLSKVTAIELPAKSAELVSRSSVGQRQQTTVEVVAASVPLNPAAAPAIVGSIAQSSPEMAAIAAATAVSLVPDQVTVIARVAAAAAPSKAGQIVEAMCRVLPADYQKIADAVAEVVPGAGRQIFTAVATAIPALKDSINQVLAGYKGNIPSVAIVLEQVPNQGVATTTPVLLSQSTYNPPSLAPPVVGPPYVPIPVNITNINPGSGGEVPPGGRNYASP